MIKMPPRILSTKKLLSNQRQFLLNAGLAVVEADFISITNNQFIIENINTNLIFTSQNGFKSFLENPESASIQHKKVFCVGIKTKELIEKNGFKVTAYTDYATDLANIICNEYTNENFTFFSGSLRHNTLPNAMKEANITFNEIEVYKTFLTPYKINTPLQGILFYSPSGIESYLKENSITTETCFCIGTTTAAALKNITQNIVIAKKQTVENVIIQAIKFYS